MNVHQHGRTVAVFVICGRRGRRGGKLPLLQPDESGFLHVIQQLFQSISFRGAARKVGKLADIASERLVTDKHGVKHTELLADADRKTPSIDAKTCYCVGSGNATDLFRQDPARFRE